jgi:glucose 1-dehydrogenase
VSRAIVTGSDSGIGRATAIALARRGWDVGITWHSDGAGARETAASVSALGGAAPVERLDLTAGPGAAIERLIDRLGGLDLLVNNAGLEKRFDLVDMPLEWWQRVIDVNLTGVFLCSRAAARMMLGAGDKGAIVNITSVHEQIPWKGFSHYCASKGGEKMFTQSIARELAPHGIRVLSIAPGAIATPINKDVLANQEAREAVEAEIPLGRWGEIADVSRAVAWAASDQADYVVGSTLFVDGGMTLYPRFV